MIQNKHAQLIFQTVYCVLGFLGILNSLGYFAADFNESFYVYYTNLSNYVCIGVMLAALLHTYKSVRRGEEGPCRIAPTFTFLCVILILVTFLVYNLLLADENTVTEYFTSQSNMLLHVILPVMFLVHWFLFCEHPTLRWYHPLLSMVMPLVYVIFILIRAPFVPDAVGAVRYPYFFLNLDALGLGGFLGWIAVLLVIFVVLGYLFYFLDRRVLRKTR